MRAARRAHAGVHPCRVVHCLTSLTALTSAACRPPQPCLDHCRRLLRCLGRHHSGVAVRRGAAGGEARAGQVRRAAPGRPHIPGVRRGSSAPCEAARAHSWTWGLRRPPHCSVGLPCCRLGTQALLAAGLLRFGALPPAGWAARAARAIIALSAASGAFLAAQVTPDRPLHAHEAVQASSGKEAD